jgi:hypothetical protein
MSARDRRADGRDIMNCEAELELESLKDKLLEEKYDLKNPSWYVVSYQEFEQLNAEHSPEVEGLSYEEYCEIEHECWNEMLKVQLEEPWKKSIPG